MKRIEQVFVIKCKGKYIVYRNSCVGFLSSCARKDAQKFTLKTAIMEIIAWSDGHNINNDFELIEI